MLYSKTAHMAGGSGFFLDEDKNAPSDVISVSRSDAAAATNLPLESTYDFDSSGNLIVTNPTAPTAAQIKAKASAARWEAIKAERDKRKTGGFKVGVQWCHSDADSRIQHLGLKDKARDLLAAGGAMADNLTTLGQPVRWKTMDGSFAVVTAQLAFHIVAAAGDLDARLFAVAETHRAAMEATSDPAAYDFSAGWPETFGG